MRGNKFMPPHGKLPRKPFPTEHRISAEQWDHKMAADCEMLSREVATALEKIRDESAGLITWRRHAAAEALQRDLPRRLAPQLEELTRDLTAQLSQEALAQGNAYAEQTGAALQTLGSACAQVEELLKRLREHAAAVEARIASFAASAEREAEETARRARIKRLGAGGIPARPG